MASDREFDDLLRRKLAGVKPPAPPAMDWSAMARAAKTGSTGTARATGSGRIWKVLTGAAVVGGVVWLGYNGIRGTNSRDTFADVQTTPEVTTNARSSEPVVSANVPFAADTQERTVLGSASVMASGKVGAISGDVASIKADRATTRTGNRTSTTSVNAASNTKGSAVTFDETIPGSQAVGGEQVLTSEDGAATNSARPNESVRIEHSEAVDEWNEVVVPPARLSSGFATPMIVLPLTAAPLALVPNVPVTDPASRTAFPRFAISPWGSVSRSIHSPAPAQVADQVDRLAGLNEWIGTAGVRVEYAFTPRLALISGVQYSNKGRLQGTISSSPQINTDYAVSGAYLEVPLSVKYEFPQAGKTFYGRSGVLMQFNARSGSDRVVMHDQGLKEMITLALSSRSMGVAVDLGVGVRFRLGRGIGLFIEPSYQYSLSPVVKNAVFDRLPYNPRIHSFGLGTGLTFQFGSR